MCYIQQVSLHIKFHVIWTSAYEVMPKNLESFSIMLYGGIVGQWGIHLPSYTKFIQSSTQSRNS